MHQKRVTAELHDSYFHLMTIKHAFPKIDSVKTGSHTVGESETSETRCARESHTLPKGPSGPPMEFWRPVGDKKQ